jgi:hypothetical protein
MTTGVAYEFFGKIMPVLQTLIYLIGGGLAVWGIINLLEGYGQDNPGAKSQGIKQLMSGIGIIILGVAIKGLFELLFREL